MKENLMVVALTPWHAATVATFWALALPQLLVTR